MQNLDLKIELWKKRLLDLGKSNRLINFKETRRTNILVTSPEPSDIFNALVLEEKDLKFSYPMKTLFDEKGEEHNSSVIMGELATAQSINEQQRTLKSIRAKAKTSMEEQGINTLFLTFGMIKWRETGNADVIFSPLLLVPVNLKIESINDPYILSKHDDEVVVNPSLAFKFEHDFGIKLPDFDEHNDSIREYLAELSAVAKRNNWEVSDEVYLSLLSFLKINMYEDLEKNREIIAANPIIKALSGDLSEIKQVPEALNNFDHDKVTPLETYQVVDADSSQQDAILLSKNGISFVLQGPPGTGKSQTITNIIAEAVSDGKKVLFVSEKMAALEVVKKRLTEVNLNDFCLTLHSHKSNKKDVLAELQSTLKLPKIKIQDDILYKLSELEEKRSKLNQYQQELHTRCAPLNASIYEINGRLAKLDDTEDVVFNIDDVENTNTERLNKYKYLIKEYANTLKCMKKNGAENPWLNSAIPVLTHELRHDIEVILKRLLPDFKNFIDSYEEIIRISGAKLDKTTENMKMLFEILDMCISSPIFPVEWLKADVDELIGLSNQFSFKCKQYSDLRSQLKRKYKESIFEVPSSDILSVMEKEMICAKNYLDSVKYVSNKDIVLNAVLIVNECRELKVILSSCIEKSKKVCETLGLDKPSSIDELIKLGEIAELVVKNPNPTAKWFNEVQLNDVIKILNDAENHQIDLIDKTNKIKEIYKDEIIDINCRELLQKFDEQYKNTLRIIATNYSIEKSEEVNKETIDLFEVEQNSRLLSSKNTIESAVKSAEKITALLHLDKINTVSELIKLSSLTEALSMNPHVTAAYFDAKKETLIDKTIRDIRLKQQENKKLTETILLKYNRDILNIDHKGMLERFKTEYSGFLKVMRGSYKQDKKTVLSCSKDVSRKISDEEIVSLLANITELRENEKWLHENYHTAHELLGDLYQEELTNWEAIEKTRESFRILYNYFGNSSIPPLLEKMMLELNFNDIKCEHVNLNRKSLSDAIKSVNEIMGKNIEDATIDSVLTEIKDIYENVRELKKDYDLILSFRLNDDLSVCVKEILKTLNAVRDISSVMKWFKEKSYLMGEYLGRGYESYESNFEKIRSSIDTVDKIKELLDNKVPDEMISILTACDYQEEDFKIFSENVNKLVEQRVSDRLDSLFKYKSNKVKNVDEIIEAIDKTIGAISAINECYHRFTSLSLDKFQYETVMIDIVSLNKVQIIGQVFTDNEKDFKRKFATYYNGTETDWTSVSKNLEFVKKLKHAANEYSLSDKFVKAVCKDLSFSETLENYKDKLNTAYSSIEGDLKWFANLFENKQELYTLDIHKVYEKIKGCMNLSLLEDWIDFLSIRKQCMDLGLNDFIEHVEEMKIPEREILNTFLKRFYKLWLDVTMLKYPAVYSFRRRTQQSIIDEFGELDSLQLEIARLRVREKLINNLPDMNVATSSIDEAGILKRELNKQRKIMPLRRLFKMIPNLLTTLKPCLMMSPLSVSLYLQSEGYEFDMVIFDEASQICTEDAIGAIIRGKQVIIAGDRFQLPPTTFFNTSYSDNVFDTEDEDSTNDLDAFDSILDEATNAIPERTLKWHYRSRHENLIAFSNAKIYKHELTTFPSNIDSLPDCGVEYIHVENGIYDRGSRKNNMIEARRVAELVFEHFDKYPNRSLGVVTFSESQQQAVENAIRQRRIADRSYEEFFSEDKDEEFFIKNLENVQGDERDTIIFSIGYGKDSSGNMYMNFGPLSKNGGYRRLNVAITRAKDNVKLVGSILPSDINIDKTNSEGVRMLKQYIEFAMNGTYSLQNELISDFKNEADSPFEEAVYEFLIKNGYSVNTQIGCSDYRIDMAVQHPTVMGAFVLGIECDGNTYHAARTVRERDRLRPSILGEMGWNIYRVWSTDWIKDTKTEGEKLLRAVEYAINNYDTYITCMVSKRPHIRKESLIEMEAACSVKDNNSDLNSDSDSENEDKLKDYNQYSFDIYEETDIYSLNTKYDDTKYFVEEIIKHEAPIHFDLLCKRIAPLMGYSKVTSKVRNEVDLILENRLSQTVTRKDDFCYHNENTRINPRIPAMNKSGRSINYISTEEIAAAMIVIIKKSGGISTSDLFSVTSRELGFNRTGTNITQAMENACEYVFENEKVREQEGKIFVL